MTCPYWEIIRDDPPPEGSDEYAMGECHRHPPAFLGPSPSDGDIAAECTPDRWSQPYTHGFQWCGEHPDFRAHLASGRPEVTR